jgi:hypothetical protein
VPHSSRRPITGVVEDPYRVVERLGGPGDRRPKWDDLVRAFCRIPNEITMPDTLVSDQRWRQL